MNFVVDGLEPIKQSYISTSCLGLLVVAPLLESGFTSHSLVLAPNSHNVLLTQVLAGRQPAQPQRGDGAADPPPRPPRQAGQAQVPQPRAGES